MPTVPYNPTPQVEQTSGRVPDVQVQGVSAAAFGGDVAQGLESMGKTFDTVGDEWYKRGMALQKLNNESEAREAEAQYTIKAGDLSAEYNALEGKAAIDGRPAYIEKLRNLRDEMTLGMTNPDTKRSFAESSLGTMSRLSLYSATHAATENKKYVIGAATASAAAAADAVAQTPDDPDVVALARRKAREAIGVIASTPGHGWSQEQANQALTEQQSGISTIQIMAQADKDPFLAAKTFAENRGHMTAADIAKVTAKIDSRQMQVGSRQIADDLTADIANPITGRPEKSLKEIQDAAREAAEKQRPGDVEYADTATARTTMRYAQIKAQQRDDEFRNNYTVTSALIGDKGSIPTTPEELSALGPDVAKAYDGLSPQRRGAVDKALVQNAKGDVPETAATLRNYLSIRGKAISDDPKEREEFLYSDVAGLPLPLKNRQALGMLQQQIKKSNTGDVRVTTAFRQLQDAGIAPRIGDANGATKDDISAYRGGLQEALDNWQLDHKGQKPALKEIKEIGARLTATQSEPGEWWGTNNVPLYKLKLPDEVKAEVTKEFEAAGKAAPTDEQIRQAYVRRRYRELLTSGKAKAMAQ